MSGERDDIKSIDYDRSDEEIAAEMSPKERLSADIRTDASGGDSVPEMGEINARSITVLAACSLALFCTVGFMNAYGVFQQYYTAQYLSNYSDFQISWLGSFAIFMLFSMGIPAGWIFDRFGPTLPLAFGSICVLVSLFMISLCTKYYQFFLAQGVLLGLGMSFVSIPATSTNPLYFKKNRALAQGVTIAGSSLGGVIWPIVLNKLLHQDGVSFGWTMRIVGFMQIPLLLIAVIFVRKPPHTPTPAQAKTSAETIEAGEATKDEKKQERRAALAQLRKPPFLLFCCGMAIAYFGFFAPFFYVSIYAVTIGVSQTFSIYLISILNAASLVGRVLAGYIADRVGYFNTLSFSVICSGVVAFCWTAVSDTAGLIVWSLAYGFISGAMLSLQFTCASKLATKDTMGAAIGIAIASVALTGLFGTPIAGELVKSGYLPLSAFAGATLLAGGVLFVLSRLALNRNPLAKI